MKFLILDTYYSGFLKDWRRKNYESKNFSYKKQLKYLLSACFGTSDYYSFNLKKLGHQAEDLVINDEILQRQWAKENNLKIEKANLFSKIQMLPLLHRWIGRPKWVQEITLAQVKKAKTDIVYLQDLSILNQETLRQVKKHCKLLVGQIASPLPNADNLKEFDLILTSFPHYVKRFRKMGISSEYFKIGFESRVLKRIGKQKRIYDVGFIGSFSPHHNTGTKLLEAVASKIPLHIWGQEIQYLSPSSPLRKNFHGEAWGLQMYKILAETKIVINRHISVAENYANNMRLYETTGMGTLLITDDKKNLNNLFKVGDEIISYKNVDDLISIIKYYLNHEKERQIIAAAGQRRTLEEHTYEDRMAELVKIISKYL